MSCISLGILFFILVVVFCREFTDNNNNSDENYMSAETLAKTAENIEEQETIADLQNEVAAMKAMLMEYGKNGNEAAGVETLQSALVANEVQDAVMQDMISRLAGSEIIAPKDSIKAGKALERYLRKAVRLATGITLYSDKPKIVALLWRRLQLNSFWNPVPR